MYYLVTDIVISVSNDWIVIVSLYVRFFSDFLFSGVSEAE